MTRTAARIHASIAKADGSFNFVVLHSSLVATSARQAEQIAVQAEGGLLQRGQTRQGVDGNGSTVWEVTLSANAAAARYWGSKAVRARAAA
jgi:hypothetical protein